MIISSGFKAKKKENLRSLIKNLLCKYFLRQFPYFGNGKFVNRQHI